MCVVVGYRDCCQVGKKSQKDHQVDIKRFVDDAHRRNKINLQMEAESNAILNISLHPLENLSRNFDGADDCAQARRKKDDVGGGLHNFVSKPVSYSL